VQEKKWPKKKKKEVKSDRIKRERKREMKATKGHYLKHHDKFMTSTATHMIQVVNIKQFSR
jgi:hypothetical protein